MDRILRIQIAAFAFIRIIINTMYRMVYPFLPVIARGLGVEISALSLALTSRQSIGVFGPFAAIFLENRGRKVGLLSGLGFFTIGVTLVVIWPTYPIFIVSMVLTTLGKYIFDPHMQGYLGDRVSYEKRGLALAVTELGWSMSFIVGVPLSGFLIARSGWMSPFGTLSILGLVSMIIIGRIIPNDSDDNVTWDRIRGNLSQVIRFPPAVAGLSIGIAISAGNEMVNLIFGVWLEDTFGLQIIALGGAAAAIGIAELGGEALMGGISDRIGKERSVGWGLAANCLAAAVFPILGQSLSGAVAALFLFFITFEFTLVSAIPMMTEIMPSARVTLMAFNIAGLSLGRMIGALAAPPIYSFGIWGSTLAAIVFNLVALLCLRWLLRFKQTP